jgi:hypothetical protein
VHVVDAIHRASHVILLDILVEDTMEAFTFLVRPHHPERGAAPDPVFNISRWLQKRPKPVTGAPSRPMPSEICAGFRADLESNLLVLLFSHDRQYLTHQTSDERAGTELFDKMAVAQKVRPSTHLVGLAKRHQSGTFIGEHDMRLQSGIEYRSFRISRHFSRFW